MRILVANRHALGREFLAQTIADSLDAFVSAEVPEPGAIQ
jgi:hypothetical protein